LSQYL